MWGSYRPTSDPIYRVGRCNIDQCIVDVLFVGNENYLTASVIVRVRTRPIPIVVGKLSRCPVALAVNCKRRFSSGKMIRVMMAIPLR